ncbi:MAG: GWxTD domain-containing protein [Bacteroidetes bacterium]|nr:GWxTD domain-containing protein [Bacteroidota bacterium]
MTTHSMCIVLLAFFVLAGSSVAEAQRRERHMPVRGGELAFFEAVQFPSDSAGVSRIDVFVRVAYDFMIFERSEKPHPDSLFAGGIELSTHVRQQEHTIVAEHAKASAFTDRYEATGMRDRYVLLHQQFHVPEGTYEVLMTISDAHSSRQQTERRILGVIPLRGDSLRIGRPIPLLREASGGESRYSVYGYGGSLVFATPVHVGIPVSTNTDASWHVRFLRWDEKEARDTLFAGTVQPTEVSRSLLPDHVNGYVDGFRLTQVRETEGTMAILELPFARFDVGGYILEVVASQGNQRDSISFPTRIYWRNMPRSLRNIEFAIDAMRYILTREEYQEMKRGDEAEMQQRFRAYWAAKDATPETMYNEMMTEYFRRVDEAIDTFRTLYERNGAMTDRGKVYILFGPPEETQRMLNSDGPAEETWYYPSLNKTFRFIDRERSGDFKLYEE